MKFEYLLERTSNFCAIQIKTIPWGLRGKGFIYKCKNGYRIYSFDIPSVDTERKEIHIHGNFRLTDKRIINFAASAEDDVKEALREFQFWIEKKRYTRKQLNEKFWMEE